MVQFSCSVLSDSLRPHGLQYARPPCLSSTPGVYPIQLVMPSNHLILCCPLLLPSIFSSFRVFSNESVLRIRWPKDWHFSFSISLSNEYSGLISFRMDWLDILAVKRTLKSLLQYPSLKNICINLKLMLMLVKTGTPALASCVGSSFWKAICKFSIKTLELCPLTW